METGFRDWSVYNIMHNEHNTGAKGQKRTKNLNFEEFDFKIGTMHHTQKANKEIMRES